ncbi:nucleotidyl transferase AbiEii/AbiGii toxin family protein [Candidatus Micrarchaeota archaeon]|nr:nucleotidyl transferase AbiEii/AbiGii toxin family protein [Candidatus Micrarchaeota archaeon]
MDLPLERKLKKQLHVKVGFLQDEVMRIVYEIDENAVLHGGTSIWRCYGGNRFSEDLDFYSGKMREIMLQLPKIASERSLIVAKLKKTVNAVYCKIENNEAQVRLEAVKPPKATPVIAAYQLMNGSSLQILSLSPEQLIEEKISAYKNRRLIRDAYDLLQLSANASLGEAQKRGLIKFIEEIEAPLDEENLKAIVYQGAVPSFKQIIEALKRRFS